MIETSGGKTAGLMSGTFLNGRTGAARKRLLQALGGRGLLEDGSGIASSMYKMEPSSHKLLHSHLNIVNIIHYGSCLEL